MLIPTISAHLQLFSVEFIDTCAHICKNSFSQSKEKGSEIQQHKEIEAILSPSEIPPRTIFECRHEIRFANDSTTNPEALNTLERLHMVFNSHTTLIQHLQCFGTLESFTQA